ncbi:hypothetical protein, partial [Snuella lapsa]|uniref:hypothetical protein n=1 Tax=Snuella lapsa TaxID=870481 RepID=UPI0031F07C72
MLINLFVVFSQNAITTWSVGDVQVDCQSGQICYPIMVQSSIDNSQLSYTTLRFFYDSALMGNLTIASVENGYTVGLVQQTFPTIGDEFGFTTDIGGFPRISVSPNVSNYIDIQNGVPTHVFDLCFTLLTNPIPQELCSPLIYDNNHTTAGTGIENDAGYFAGDAGIATQYVIGGGGAIAGDDEAIQFLWSGDSGFVSPLDTQGETVGSVTTTGCIITGCNPDTGTVSGHLYIDTNGNGVQDPGEPDLSNVDVVVTDAYGGTQTVTTDANGDWAATVPAGATVADV